MTEAEAQKAIEEMPEAQFQAWYNTLPYRTRLCIEGGLVDWREVLGEWYRKSFPTFTLLENDKEII